MERTESTALQVGPVFQHLVLQQHLVLPFGTVGDLLHHLQQADRGHLYLLIRGIRGSYEGITLEAYLRAAQESVFLTAEGLYGLKRASLQGDGLTVSVDITPALEALQQAALQPQTACTLLLQPRFPLQDNEILRIEQIALFADVA